MLISELRKNAKQFWPAVILERYFGDFGNGLFSIIIYGGVVVFGVISLIFKIFTSLSSVQNFLGDFARGAVVDLGQYFNSVYGLFFVFLSIGLTMRAVKAFHDSYAYSDIVFSSVVKKDNDFGVTYESASLLLQPDNSDPVLAFLNTPVGRMTFYRLGMAESDVRNFVKNRVKIIRIKEIDISDKDLFDLNLSKLTTAIISFDKEFSVFLASRRVTNMNFIGASIWAEYILRNVRLERRWWSRDKLGRIQSIGRSWSYGETPTLEKFSISIRQTPYYSEAMNFLSLRKKEILELENVLSKIRGANALVVAEADEEAMGVIASLGLMIARGNVMPAIENKQMFVLDYASLVGLTKEKFVFEAKMMLALQESIKAGNVIVVIKDLPGLIESSKQIGSDILNILEWYFNSPDVHIIATANNQSFHSVIENNGTLMRHLEKILLKGAGVNSVLNYLMNEALSIEAEANVMFLYQAISESAESAERFFFGSNIEDKAADLLIEAATGAKSTGVKIIGKEEIMRLVEGKTGIPRDTNNIDTDSSILLSLEKILSERVVGQEEGIKAISGAMRRAHVGIGSPNRPLGSFLFLGPTGVGKTETTKALADAFFGGESAIIRLDMSEYRTADALERLIGNFALGKPGVLSSKLRDKPYGVLLLDEFEKTSKDVMDLFLQILDEGIFSDMSGKRVSARNLIIIATSNAGSGYIWNTIRQFGELSLNKDKIVAEIIDEGIFKPELLNRFDGVVVFHPLNRSSLVKIAELMLAKLNKRLAEKGLVISVTPELVNALVEKGTDPTFGARPMNRAIQDKVETFVADKILRGEAMPGTKISFTPEEIEAIRR